MWCLRRYVLWSTTGYYKRKELSSTQQNIIVYWLLLDFTLAWSIQNWLQCTLFTQKKICIAIVSNFSWVLKSSQEKSKTMVFHFFSLGGGRGKQVVLLCMWKLWMAGLSGSQGTFEQIGCKKSRSRSYAAGSRLFRLSSMCPGSLKAAPQRRLGSFRILVIKHLGLEGKLASFPKQALLQNPPGQLKFRSIAWPTIWLLLVACIARFLKELVINNYGKRMENKIYKLANK